MDTLQNAIRGHHRFSSVAHIAHSLSIISRALVNGREVSEAAELMPMEISGRIRVAERHQGDDANRLGAQATNSRTPPASACRLPKVAALLEEAEEDVLALFAFLSSTGP